MNIKAVKDLVNARLAGEQLTYSTLRPYLDAVVDDINSKLHAKFKTFSEVSEYDTTKDYTEFPDKYIRTVVAIGAASKWYTDDEEGIETATALAEQYRNNLFIMVRDYGPLVPEDKQADSGSGYLQDPYSSINPEIKYIEVKGMSGTCTGNFQIKTAASGINPEFRYIEVEGVPGTSIEKFQIKTVSDGSKHLYATLIDYKYGSKVIDCGVVSPEIVTIKMDVEGNLIGILSDGTVHVIGNMPKFMQQYIQVSVGGTLTASQGTHTIGFEIGEL